jgi:cobalt/nickel transport system permease protein
MVRGMTATRWLLAYLAAVVAVTFIHEAWLLAALLAAALAAGGAGRWRIARRAVLAGLTFNLAVSLGYAAMSLWQGRFSAQYLLLVNLRVLLLLYLGFWFVARVNLLEAVRFSPTLGFVVTLAAGQIQAFSRAAARFPPRLRQPQRRRARRCTDARAPRRRAGRATCSTSRCAWPPRRRWRCARAAAFDDYAGLPSPACGRGVGGEGGPVWRPRRPGVVTAYKKP